MTVFLSVVQAADAPPDNARLFLPFPTAPSVQRAALSAHQPLRQGVFAGVAGSACGCALLGWAAPGIPSGQLCLNLLIDLAADNCGMVVLDQHHGKLAGILHDFSAHDVVLEGLLSQSVTAVFFVGKDGLNSGSLPLCRTGRVGNFLVL